MTIRPLGFLLLVAVVGWYLNQSPSTPKPNILPTPERKRPLLPIPPRNEMMVTAQTGGTVSPKGEEVQIDYPTERHMKNTGGSDGAGLCVFTSIEMAADDQNVEQLLGFQKWMTRRPGGGYPSKVTKTISDFCKERSLSEPRYLQVEGREEVYEILKLACRTGRMPGVTYSFSPTGRYGGMRIAHMVNILHCTDSEVCVLDNNFPKTYEWMSKQEFLRTFTGGRDGWAVILLDSGSPYPPSN